MYLGGRKNWIPWGEVGVKTIYTCYISVLPWIRKTVYKIYTIKDVDLRDIRAKEIIRPGNAQIRKDVTFANSVLLLKDNC